MKLTENQKNVLQAIRNTLDQFELQYFKLKKEDCVDIDTIIDTTFEQLSNNEEISYDISILKDELFDVLTSVEELNYEEKLGCEES